MKNPTTGRKIQFFFYCVKDPFDEPFLDIQLVHIFVKSRKVRNLDENLARCSC